MKKLFPILSVALLACAAASCSSTTDTDTASDEPEFQQSSAAETSSEAAESSEESPSATTAGEEEDKEEDDSGLQEKDKEAFIATNAPSHATSTVYGVSSPDDRVACTVTEDKGLIGCNVNFADPPLYPATGLPTWLSNSVDFDQDKGFYPNLKLGGDSAPPTTLEAGSTVSMAGVTFEAASEDEFTVTIDGHHFTVKDQGQYYSDTFPPKPDAEGHAITGTICGDLGDGEYVYAKTHDTNCARAMEVLDFYKNYDFAPMEGGNRGYLMKDDFSCSYNADAGWPDQPEYRWLGCSIEGSGEVVVLDSNARALISAQG